MQIANKSVQNMHRLLLKDLEGDVGAGFCICQGIVMMLQVVATEFCNCLELMVLRIRESFSGCYESAEERIVRVIHLVAAEDGFQTGFIKGFVVGDKWQGR